MFYSVLDSRSFNVTPFEFFHSVLPLALEPQTKLDAPDGVLNRMSSSKTKFASICSLYCSLFFKQYSGQLLVNALEILLHFFTTKPSEVLIARASVPFLLHINSESLSEELSLLCATSGSKTLCPNVPTITLA